jgi:LDH2 family malate/lactate/ureidoglycolate dehydrogenase
MQDFIRSLFEKVDVSGDRAEHMAVALVANDARCVFSHGTRQVCAYVPQIREGKANPNPDVTIVSESVATAVIDGDGGLGYFAAHRGTEIAIQKALEAGSATVTTRNHFHFGAAGNYSRMALPHDCIGLAISSHRYRPNPEATVMSASGGSPMSIAIPTGEQPPFVLDMSASFLRHDEDLMTQFPSVFFKALGLGTVFQMLGGILTGIWNEGFEYSGEGEWAAPHQGAFISVFDVKRFADVSAFKEEMDRYIGEARSTRPIAGQERADLAGGLEWEWERENREKGIPVAPEHREVLEKLAGGVGVEAPFERYGKTRF